MGASAFSLQLKTRSRAAWQHDSGRALGPRRSGRVNREVDRDTLSRALFLLTIVLAVAREDKGKIPVDRTAGTIEVVATFDGPMPTGVTVSSDGRIFVNFPRWGDAVDFTVAELKDGKAVAYPDETFARFDKSRPGQTLVSVQSVVVDPSDRLWMLDTGSIEFGPPLPGGAELVGVDLKTNRVFKTIPFPTDVALKTTYLNDIRFDLRKGRAGVAYITDSAQHGPNGIIVVDLETGKSRRRLNDHPSTKPEKNFLPIVEGRPLMERKPGQPPRHLAMGSDGIAISHDGKHLYYCPLSSRHLYRVPTDALLDESASDEAIGKLVDDLGIAASLRMDWNQTTRAASTSPITSITRFCGEPMTGNHDAGPRPTHSLAGYAFVGGGRPPLLHRQSAPIARSSSTTARTRREKPYVLFRTKVDGGPVRLRRQ